MGRPEPEVLLLGTGVLPATPGPGKNSRRRAPVPGAALAENPMENVADKNLLQRRFPHGQSTQTRILGSYGKIRQIPVNNFYEKALLSTENFWAMVGSSLRDFTQRPPL